jgi:glycosyltransferase involved in cell wall biosynthesis
MSERLLTVSRKLRKRPSLISRLRSFLELLPYRVRQRVPLRDARALQSRNIRPPRVFNDNFLSGKKRLFVDLAVISDHDAGTGIQRVVRALAVALQRETSAGEALTRWDIHFVSARRKKRYHKISWPDRSKPIEAEEMRARPGDVFVGLDYSLDAVRRHRGQLAKFRRQGGSLWFLVHDLLPLNRPEWFSRNTVIRYKAWLSILVQLAEGFLCNSLQTEAELREAIAKHYGVTDGYRTLVLPMGHDILDERDTLAAKAGDPRFDTSIPFALMVGTLEPRKAHIDVVAAFGELWARGGRDRLVLVGRLGWQVDNLRDLIINHPEYGTQLLWLDDVEDAELLGIYQACTGVIIASHGEGFGLPLIEALGRGKPVLARDLPVFRTHDGKGVHFFPADASPGQLATALEQWLAAARANMIEVVRPTSGWRDAALLALATIEQS